MNNTASARALALTVTVVLLIGLSLAVLGCAPATAPPAPDTAELPTDPPGITGAITYVAAGTSATSLGSITVEGGEQPAGAVSDKAVVNVTNRTKIFDSSGKPTAADKLQVGVEVEVWFTGPVAESYPVQGAASAIQITGTAPK